MEKTIIIDGKQVLFKSTGLAVPLYMSQFNRDLVKDILSMGVMDFDFDTAPQHQKIDWMRNNIDFNMFFNIAWLFAKIADKRIPDPFTWLDSFDEFPIFEIMEPLQDLLVKTVGVKKNATVAPPNLTKTQK